MGCECSLPVRHRSHGFENLLKVAPHAPSVWAGRFGQAHTLEHGQPCRLVLCPDARTRAQPGLNRISDDIEVRCRVVSPDLLRDKPTVERSDTGLGNFAVLRLLRVSLRAVPELAGAQVAGNLPNPVLNILPG